MIFSQRTARLMFCPEKFETCQSDKCPKWRWTGIPKGTKLDEVNHEKYFGYCGAGGVPTCEVRQPVIS